MTSKVEPCVRWQTPGRPPAHSIPAASRLIRHGDRAHGLAWDPGGDSVWSVDTNKRVIINLHAKTGEILNAVGCTGLEPHGMTIWHNEFWGCDAESRAVWTFELPST